MVRNPVTTSLTKFSTSELSDDAGQIREDCLGYFSAKAQSDAHELVLRRFMEFAQNGGTRADICRRLNKRPEQVTRWLAGPGNWTLETVSYLLLAMGGVPEFKCRELADMNRDANQDQLGRAVYFIATTTPANTSSSQISYQMDATVEIEDIIYND